MTAPKQPARPASPAALPQLGEIGLAGYAPYLMNRIMGSYNAAVQAETAGLGLTTTKLRVLAVLSVIPRQGLGELAAATVTGQSTLSRTVDQMVAEGLVSRGPDPDDSRAVRIALTASGRDCFTDAWPAMARHALRMFDGIPEAERLAFVATLGRVLGNLGAPQGPG